MLSQRQLDEFSTRGFLRIASVYSPENISAMKDQVWHQLGQSTGIAKDFPETWPHSNGPVVCESLLQKFSLSPNISGLLNELLGFGNWSKPNDWGATRVQFPEMTPSEWAVPQKGWDFTAQTGWIPDRLFGVKCISFLSEFTPEEGGHLVISGSHKLVEAAIRESGIGSHQEKVFLLKHLKNSSAWLQELTDGPKDDPLRTAFFTSQTSKVHGIDLQVETLSAQPGDVFILHPWLLHTLAPICSETPKLFQEMTLRSQPFLKQPKAAQIQPEYFAENTFRALV